MDQHIWNWALQVESVLQTRQVQEDDPNEELEQLKVYFLGKKTNQTKYSQLGCFKVINKLMTSLQGLSTAMESPQMSPPAAGDTAHKTRGNSSSSSFSSSIPTPTASRTGGQCPANALQQRLGAGNAGGKALREFPDLFLLNSSLTPQEQPCSGKPLLPFPASQQIPGPSSLSTARGWFVYLFNLN